MSSFVTSKFNEYFQQQQQKRTRRNRGKTSQLAAVLTHTHTHGKPGKMQCKIHFTRIAVNFCRSAEALTTCLEIAAVLGPWPRFALKFLIASLKHLSLSLSLLCLSLSAFCAGQIFTQISITINCTFILRPAAWQAGEIKNSSA